MLAFFETKLGTWAIIGLLMLASAAGGAAKMWQHEQPIIDAEKAKYSEMLGGVKTLGVAAIKANAAKAAQDKLDKENADANRKTVADAVAARVARMRQLAAARDTHGGSVSPGPAGTKCPDGQTCFDKPEYQRTLGIFDTGARRLANEGTSVTIDLNTAKCWAIKQPQLCLAASQTLTLPGASP